MPVPLTSPFNVRDSASASNQEAVAFCFGRWCDPVTAPGIVASTPSATARCAKIQRLRRCAQRVVHWWPHGENVVCANCGSCNKLRTLQCAEGAADPFDRSDRSHSHEHCQHDFQFQQQQQQQWQQQWQHHSGSNGRTAVAVTAAGRSSNSSRRSRRPSRRSSQDRALERIERRATPTCPAPVCPSLAAQESRPRAVGKIVRPCAMRNDEEM